MVDEVSVDETGPAPVLVNCTNRAQHVLVGTRVVPLAKVTRPSFVDMMGERSTLEVRAEIGSTESMTLDVVSGEVQGTLMLPPVLPGVLYLVEAEVMLRCPERDDLVAPAGYSWLRTGGLDLSEYNARDDILNLPDDGDGGGRVSVLSTVATTLGVVTADTPNQVL